MNMKEVTLDNLKRDLNVLADPKRARASQRFFKTGPGEYAEGDRFLGITVPAQRKVAHAYIALKLPAVGKLLRSPIHEHRFVALEILVAKYERGDLREKGRVFNFYLRHKAYVNNWDLVDTSAEYIPGDYLFGKKKEVLFTLARSKNIWQRRMAIVATFCFIKKGRFGETLKISKILLADEHDLIHKAVGWMLREVGKRSLETELQFLDVYYRRMPRTMLRYAIERFPEKKRKHYLERG